MRSRRRARSALSVRSVLTALCVFGAVLAGSAQAATAQADQAASDQGASAGPGAVPGPVVLLGTGGLRWADVGSSTPTLSALLNQDSSGWLAARSVRSVTCPVDGWLAVSAGRRAADVKVGPAVAEQTPSCRDAQLQVTTPGGSSTLPQWQTYQREAGLGTFQAHPGELGAALGQARLSTAAVGPGAAIALADSQGTVTHAWPGRVDDAEGTVDPAVLAGDVKSALSTYPALLVVDLGQIRDPAQLISGEPKPTGSYARPRAAQVRSLDTRLGLVLGELPPTATVVVASMADSGTPAQLQLLAARGPAPLGGSYTRSLLGSASTRQDGLAQTTDLTPTILTALSVPVPVDAVGSPLRPVQPDRSAAQRLRKLNDLAEASASVTPIVPWFFTGLVAAQVVLYGAAALLFRRQQRDPPADRAANPNVPIAGRRRTLRLVWQAAVVFAAVPAATFLANLLPWWRVRPPGLGVTGAVIIFVIPVAGLALLGPWRALLLGPFGAVSAITAAVLAVDPATGSKLALSSLMGVQPIIAGRFYGFGNVAFAVFATGALLLAIAVADRQIRRGQPRLAGLCVAVIGIVATVVDGAPVLGADFGGPPAIIPAFAVLALLAAGVRVTWRRVLLIAVGTLTVVVALSVLDWLRGPSNRTHLGRFVQTVIDGGGWPVIQRKADQNVTILFSSYLSALLPFAVAFAVFALARPMTLGLGPLQRAYDRSPMLRPGLAAFGVLMLLGTALNDSGSVVPADAAMLAIPLLIAASIRALELDGVQPDDVELDDVDLDDGRSPTSSGARSGAGTAPARHPDTVRLDAAEHSDRRP